jgi:hypothetical protein
MIKIFRKIRQNMIKENNVSKYLLYAIGEIILVVIGILIALSVNNWNQERLNQQRVNGYLKSLTEDLKSDIEQYNFNIKAYTNDIDNNSSVLQNDAYKKLEVDSISELVISYYQIDKTSNQTYERIKNAGLIESLGSEEINKAINDYYNLEITYYQGLLQWDKGFNDKDVEFWLYNSNFESNSNRDYDTHLLRFKDSPTKRKDDLIKLIESTQGRNHIRNAIVRHKHMLFRVNNFKATTQNLLDLINIETAKN